MWKLQNLSAGPSKLEPFLCKDENGHVAKGKYVLLQVLIFKFWLIVNPFIGSMNENITLKSNAPTRFIAESSVCL